MRLADGNGPVGELTLRTLAMPADANAAGDIFGGWVMAQMDLACGMRAAERARGRVVTAAVTTRPLARSAARMPQARSICAITQPPKISPAALASAGMASVRSVRSPTGRPSA